MKKSQLHEIVKVVAQYYQLHPDCLSNSDNSQEQNKARQIYVLLALKLGYTVGDTAKAIRRTVKQIYNTASSARKNRLTDDEMQMSYSVCLNVLLQKGEKIRKPVPNIDYKKYEPFVSFTKKELADMIQAQINAEAFMKSYGLAQASIV